MAKQQHSTCARCGRLIEGDWVCPNCGHASTMSFVIGGLFAPLGIAIALVVTLALLPADLWGGLPR